MVAVDIGAGTGFWTLPLARIVGPNGAVYAVDVEPVMREELRALADAHDLRNVQVVASDEISIPLPDGIADLAVAGFVLHEPADHAAFVREIARLLKVGGRLLVVDWQKKPTEQGPLVGHRLSCEHAAALLTEAALTVEVRPSPTDDVYILLAKREEASGRA